MRPEGIPNISGPAIVCAQAGNVNTGAFDPIEQICRVAHDSGARVVIINGQPTEMDGLADQVLRGSIGEILPLLLE